MAPTTTLRVRVDTRDRINRLAAEQEISAPDLLEQLVEKAEQDRLLSAMNSSFERLRQDEAAWADFKAETAEWDSTSADGGGAAG